MQDGLSWLKRDEEGAYVMAHRIATDCDPSWGEQKVRRCPIADANRLAPLAQTYQAHRAGLGSLWDFYKSPSCAVVEYWTELHHQTELMRARVRERAAEEARHG